jgi:hypothetical protein
MSEGIRFFKDQLISGTFSPVFRLRIVGSWRAACQSWWKPGCVGFHHAASPWFVDSYWRMHMKPRCFIGFFALLGFLLAACAQQIANPVPIKSYPTQATETTAELTLKPTALPKAEQAQVNPLNAESESTESAVQNDQPAIIWNAKAATCEVAEISTAEVSFGSCEGAQRSEPILEETGRPEELAYFLQTYAPFQVETDAGDIVFHGEGGQQATPIEERMIAEWARQAFLEASAGRRDAPHL